MRVLVLGGTHHVGRAAVEVALARGDEVTTVNRGVTGIAVPGVEARYADRRDAAAFEAALGNDTWDAVLDTWSLEPAVVASGAAVLKDRVGHYGYVSSRSVYTWPIPSNADESAPIVPGDPRSVASENYAEAKRGGELAVLEAFGDRALLARAGMILGPYEIVGRLPWWLGRLARGGRVPAPGPFDRPLQYVDARDLVSWMLSCAGSGTVGVFDTVSLPGHTTIGALLEECVRVSGSKASLVWVTPEQVADAGLSGWTNLPIWVPPTGELASLHDGDTRAAAAAGLACRPMEETVADTWAWLQREGWPEPDSSRTGSLGLSAEQEQRLLS